MPLLFASIGDELSITSISGTQASRQHLSDMGFSEGSKIVVIQKISTGLIVKVKESRIAIDKSMASKIQVAQGLINNLGDKQIWAH